MKIHREGHKMLLVCSVTLIVLNFGVYYIFNTGLIFYLLIFLSAFLILALLVFFRDPGRNIVLNDKYILSPADGKIVAIEEIEEKEFFNDRRIQVSVFMSPLNVHSNRNPFSGKVKYVKYHPGKYLVAWHPKSSFENERNTVVITNGKMDVLMRQIAGAMARRIVNYVKVGDAVIQGQDFGFIKFGSRVDIILSPDTTIKVHIGQKSRAGITVIATI